MEQVIKELLSPSKRYKVEIIQRENGFFSTEVYKWKEVDGFEYWSPIKKGLSLIDTKENADKVAIQQLKAYSSEVIDIKHL
ncbi:hypothetical protein PU629_19325 [Pullulanibacillus sp. KACC 23026]|uniref:hypothetical protein n=1 Tax=Pullulanibacillus sp. KACC 23026 TaxID=3028315 RepID=UPI0023AEA20D|nr:hypothetical protein [Pullulanibacillus sp. KACC 23026]WEG12245.1 hypothetical protein PU629_19325 [Pullulanibacillus sp. KACC 23026]